MRFKPILVTCFLFLSLSGCAESDDSAGFTLNDDQPFRFEFGRGSGWHGLDTIKVEEDGSVTLHRMHSELIHGVVHLYWETTSLSLSVDQFDEIRDLIVTSDVLQLDREYHADIHDGTQWVFWIQQGEQEKSVYFNNNFPEAITQFAVDLDALLSHGLGESAWQRVPEEEGRQHEEEIWESIRR